MSVFYKETDTCSPKPLFEQEDYSLSPFPSLLILHHSLANSNFLFFIQHVPENTLKPCWFFIQINHTETSLLDLDSKNTGDFHFTFISRHPFDSHLCDNTTRWWSLWHEYKNNKNNVPIYGARMLFDPKRKPDPSKYSLWTDSTLN